MNEMEPRDIIASGPSIQIWAPPPPPPRWVPGFVLDLICWARSHKPFSLGPFAWTEHRGATWELCARCGRLCARKP